MQIYGTDIVAAFKPKEVSYAALGRPLRLAFFSGLIKRLGLSLDLVFPFRFNAEALLQLLEDYIERLPDPDLVLVLGELDVLQASLIRSPLLPLGHTEEA